MKYIFSLEPLENLAESQLQGTTVYRKTKVVKKDEKGKPVLGEDGKPEMHEVDMMQEMVEVIIPADRNTKWYGKVEDYLRLLNRDINDNEDNHAAYRMALAVRENFMKQLERFRTNSGDTDVEGTPLLTLGLSKKVIEHLMSNSVATVEELAALSDQQCQSLGMGAVRFRNQAQHFMKGQEANDTKKLVAAVENLRAEKETSEAAAKTQFDAMQRQIESLTKQLAQKNDPEPAAAPKK